MRDDRSGPLKAAFFDRNALEVAPALLGKLLVHEIDAETKIVGRVVETEAYTGDDAAFHAWGIIDGPTGSVVPSGRGYDLFAPPGNAYVYLCYGMYWMLNVVTEREGVAGCVLIRAVEPIAGINEMYERRPTAANDISLTDGPGKLTMAFGIDKDHHKQSLCSPPLYFAHGPPPAEAIRTSSRIGITRAVDHQWRYFLEGNPWVSKGTPSDVAAERRRERHRGRPKRRRNSS